MGPQRCARGGLRYPSRLAGVPSFFAVRQDGARRFLGALWGPVDVNVSSQYFLGATRPTIPVAELTAITIVLMLLRHT